MAEICSTYFILWSSTILELDTHGQKPAKESELKPTELRSSRKGGERRGRSRIMNCEGL